MTVTLRSEAAPTSATLVIHMGAGAIDSVVNAALRNYGEYRTLTGDSSGIFAVSVFAVTGDVTEAQIIDALPQRSFARATVGAVTDAGFGVLPTVLADVDLAPEMAAIQQVHYDIALPTLSDARLAALDPLDDESLEAAARAHLAPLVERLLALFGPRLRK